MSAAHSVVIRSLDPGANHTTRAVGAVADPRHVPSGREGGKVRSDNSILKPSQAGEDDGGHSTSEGDGGWWVAFRYRDTVTPIRDFFPPRLCYSSTTQGLVGGQSRMKRGGVSIHPLGPVLCARYGAVGGGTSSTRVAFGRNAVYSCPCGFPSAVRRCGRLGRRTRTDRQCPGAKGVTKHRSIWRSLDQERRAPYSSTIAEFSL